MIKQKFNYSIKTPEQLYENLVNKWLEIDISKEEVIHFLKHHSYFQFMLYFKKYRNNEHKFNDWIKFSLLRDTYFFDQKFRLILLFYISEIENSFKNNFCQIICNKLWNTWRTEKKHFKVIKIFDEVIQSILNDIDKNNVKSEFIKKYVEKYNNPKYPPFWNMLEVLTFWQISIIYKSIENSYKKTIANVYSIDNSILENWLQSLVLIRNICCHHNKLFDRNDLLIIKIPKKFIWLDIFEWHERNVFWKLSIICFLLTHLKIEDNFISELKILFEKYNYIPQFIRNDWEEKILLLKKI